MLLQTSVLVLDTDNGLLHTPTGWAELTPTEVELMAYLLKHPGEYHSTDYLLQAVWGYPTLLGGPSLVRQHVANIRQRIEPDPERPRYLLMRRLRGYWVEA